MFRADAGIVETGRDRMRLGDLAVLVLQQIGLVAVEHAGRSAGEAGGMLALSSPWPAASTPSIATSASSRNGWNRPIAFDPPPIAATSRSGRRSIRPRASARALPCRSPTGSRGPAPDRMRAGGGADDVESVVDVRDPVAQGLVHRILQRLRAGGDGRGLRRRAARMRKTLGCCRSTSLGAHEDRCRAGRSAPRPWRWRRHAGRRRSPAMMRVLPMRHGEQDLADAIVDLVRAGVVQLLALEIDLRALARRGVGAQSLGQALGIIERARAADIMVINPPSSAANSGSSLAAR